jgi:glycosyltransferase involved in cell wall biosynthesis
MVKALVALGHRVDLLTFPQGEPVEIAGVVHRRSLRLPVGRVRAGASLAKVALDIPFVAEALGRMAFGGYDVVHAVEEAAHLVAPAARCLRLPLVADVDSSIPDQLRYSGFAGRGPLPWIAERLFAHALRHATIAVTVCASLTEGVKARAPLTPVFQVEDPPLVGDEEPDPMAVDALRRELGLGPLPVVLYSGNFESYQGVEMLVEAATAVPEAQVVFMGGELEQVAEMKVRAGGRCVFAGKRPPTTLPTFLALTDVLVSPRRQGDNTPFKIYTYLASGRPIVATRIPTHTQLLDDTTAFLVDPSADGLAEGIRKALGEPREAAARAARGRALIDREYSPARYAEKVEAAYAEVERSVAANRSRL